ncbi:transposase [Micrococcus luteus]|nr:transposase [Micrococcus luteus]
MPASYPKEFRDDVVRVALNREHGTRLNQIAKDFGVSDSCLTNWIWQAEVEAGNKPGATAGEAAELRAAGPRIRLLEQENDVLRRARPTSPRRTYCPNDVPAPLRARRRRYPRRGDVPAPGAIPPALLLLAEPPRDCLPNRAGLPGQRATRCPPERPGVRVPPAAGRGRSGRGTQGHPHRLEAVP